MKATQTRTTLTQARLAEVVSFQGRPCLSLYQPTHRSHPDNQQDPIRFRQVAGRIDASTGRIDPAELGRPRVDDVLDDLGALVEKRGGEVHVLSAERMPSRTGVAASFRH